MNVAIDIDRIELLLDQTEDALPRQRDEAMSTWARRAFGEGYLNRDDLDQLIAFATLGNVIADCINDDDSDAADEQPFALVNDKPRAAPWKPEPREPMRQRMLLSGLDCLEGQSDLFAVDGEEAGDRPQALHHLIDDVAEGCFDG